MPTYDFGVSGDTNLAAGTFGILQNFTYRYSSDEATAQNAMGDVGAQTIFNEVTEVDCEYVFDTLTSLPAVGDTIAIGGTNKFTVMSVEKTETNVEYTKATLSLKRYTVVGIPTN